MSAEILKPQPDELWEDTLNGLFKQIVKKVPKNVSNNELKQICLNDQCTRDVIKCSLKRFVNKHRKKITPSDAESYIAKATEAIDLRIKLKYLNKAFECTEKKLEIHKLRTQILKQEKKYPACLQEIDQCLRFFPNSKEFLGKKKNIIGEARKYMSQLKRANFKNYKEGFTENEEFPSSSKLLNLKYNEQFGRHVISNETIKKEDILFIEDPFTFVILDEFREDYCHLCCAEIQTMYPCETCFVNFCSPNCLESSKKIHKWECPGMCLFDQTGLAYLAIKIIFSVGPYKNLKKILDSEMVKKHRKDYIPKGYEGVYHLSFKENMAKEDYIRFAMVGTLFDLMGMLYASSFYFYFANQN